MQKNIHLKDLAFKALYIAINAGKIIMNFYGEKSHLKKEDKSPLTQADIESNAYITEQLQSISTYKVCSEEAILEYGERKDLEYFWLIDPLDGTKDFLVGNGNFTVNIALVNKNKIILGIVYAPCLYEAYIGFQGFGSFGYNILDFKTFMQDFNTYEVQLEWLKSNKIPLNKTNVKKIYGAKLEYLDNIDKDIKSHILENLSTHKNKQKRLIACDSLFHSTKETQDFLKKYNAIILQRGSSLKICALASGIADIYPRMNGTSEWDTAASDIILQESGGIIIDLQTKQPLHYNKENIQNNHFIAFTSMYRDSDIYKDLVKWCNV